MNIIRNPALQWDGKTEYQDDDNRAIERPHEWHVDVERIPGQKSPYIFHRDVGFNVDANHVRAHITWSQNVMLPPGEHYLLVKCISQVSWGSDDYSVAFRVEIETRDRFYKTSDLWLSRHKGDQSFAVKLVTDKESPALLRLIYWTKWADTDGSLQLMGIDIQPQPMGFSVRNIISMAELVEQPPHTDSPPDDTPPETTPAPVPEPPPAPAQPPPTYPSGDDASVLAAVLDTLAVTLGTMAREIRTSREKHNAAGYLRKMARALDAAAEAMDDDSVAG